MGEMVGTGSTASGPSPGTSRGPQAFLDNLGQSGNADGAPARSGTARAGSVSQLNHRVTGILAR